MVATMVQPGTKELPRCPGQRLSVENEKAAMSRKKMGASAYGTVSVAQLGYE